MNDRVSTVPPAQFLGPEEIRSYESQFYTDSEREERDRELELEHEYEHERPFSSGSQSQTTQSQTSSQEDEAQYLQPLSPPPQPLPPQEQHQHHEHQFKPPPPPHNHPYPSEYQEQYQPALHPALAAKKSSGFFGRVRDALGLRSRGGSVTSSMSASMSVSDSRPQSQATSLMSQSQGTDPGQDNGHARRKHISMPEPPSPMITKTKTATGRGRHHHQQYQGQYQYQYHRQGPRSQSQTNVPLMHQLSHQTSGGALNVPLQHHPSFASMAAATQMGAASPFASASGDRPSREEILQSYQQLMASGFFKAHAIQSTRQPPPGARARPSSRQGQQQQQHEGGHHPQLPTIPSVGSGLERDLPPPSPSQQPEFRLHELTAASKLKQALSRQQASTSTPMPTTKPQPQLRRRHPMLPGRKRSRADLDDGFSSQSSTRSSTESMAAAASTAPTSAAALAPTVSVTAAPEEGLAPTSATMGSTSSRTPSPLKRVAKKIRKMPSSIAAATASTSSLFGSASTNGGEDAETASRPASPSDAQMRNAFPAAQSTSSLAGSIGLHAHAAEGRGAAARLREPSPAPSFAPSFAPSVGSDRTISMPPPPAPSTGGGNSSSVSRIRSKMGPPSAGLNRAASRFGGRFGGGSGSATSGAEIRREPSAENVRRPFNNRVVNAPPGAQNSATNGNEGAGDSSRQSSNSSMASGVSIRHVGRLVGVETTPRSSGDMDVDVDVDMPMNMDMDTTPRASVDAFEGPAPTRGRSRLVARAAPPSAGMNGLNRVAGRLGGRIRRQLSGSSIGRSLSRSRDDRDRDGDDEHRHRDRDDDDGADREQEQQRRPQVVEDPRNGADAGTPRGRRTMKSPPSAGLNKVSGATSGGGLFGNIKRSLSGSRISGRLNRHNATGDEEKDRNAAAAGSKEEGRSRRTASKLLRRAKSPSRIEAHHQQQQQQQLQDRRQANTNPGSDATTWVSEFGFVGGGRGVALSGSRGDRQHQHRFSAMAASPTPKRESSLRGSWTKRSLKSRSEGNAGLAMGVATGGSSRVRTPSPSPHGWMRAPTTPSPTKTGSVWGDEADTPTKGPLAILPDTASNRGTPTPSLNGNMSVPRLQDRCHYNPRHHPRHQPRSRSTSPQKPHRSPTQQQRGFEIAAALGVPADHVVFDENRMVVDWPYGQAL